MSGAGAPAVGMTGAVAGIEGVVSMPTEGGASETGGTFTTPPVPSGSCVGNGAGACATDAPPSSVGIARRSGASMGWVAPGAGPLGGVKRRTAGPGAAYGSSSPPPNPPPNPPPRSASRVD
jgi:hypothetical protein